jgi:GDPmannose 4,6-dehydratase
MKALIFGINGQDGHFLSNICENRGIEVIGISRSNGNWRQGSISDEAFVAQIIKSESPDFIFHLAANSTTRHEAILENYCTIVGGTMNILEATWKFSPATKVFIAGSGLQFENDGTPIKETNCLTHNTAYALTRNQSLQASRYYRSLGLRIYNGFLFHHESPLRKDTHLSKYTTDYIKKIAITNDVKPMSIGDISVRKEWGYAKDICEGIFTLIGQDSIFEATIGTGVGHTIKDWLEICFGCVNLNWRDYVVEKNEGFIAEYPVLISDNSTMQALGWHPTTTLKKLAELMLK